MPLEFTFINHLIPVFITITLFLIAVALIIASPYLYYITLVAAADDEEGEIRLAKHLAHKAGGSKIHVEKAWEGFIPAAREIHQIHVRRVDRIENR